MNLPGLDPVAPAANGGPRGAGTRRDDGGGASPFARMIEPGPGQRGPAGSGRSDAPRAPRDPARDASDSAGDEATTRRSGGGEPAADDTAADAAAFAADAVQPWPPHGLAALGLIAVAPADGAELGADAGLDADAAAAAWAQLVTAANGGAGGNPSAPAIALGVVATDPAAPGLGAALAQASARTQPAAQPAPAAEPAVPATLEPLVLRNAGGDGDAPAPAFLVAPVAPSQAAREAPPALAPPPTPTPNLHGDDFAEAVGTRLHWLAEQKIGHAQIRITPHDLGPIEVRIRLDGDRVSADFSSAQAEVRQALETSLPRLRDMLAAQGFQLAHADVGQQSRQDGTTARQRADATGAGGSGEDGTPQSSLPAIPAARGLVDAYA